MDQAYDNLFIGDVNDADNPKRHDKKDIEYILNLSGASTETDSAPGYSIVKNQNYIHIPLEDGTGNSEFMLRTAIETARKLHLQAMEEDVSLLVHCAVGSSRSAVITAALMSLENKERVEENVLRLKKVRPIVNPVEGLQRQVNDITAEIYNE